MLSRSIAAVAAALPALSTGAFAIAGEPAAFTYRSAESVTFTVTADGLSGIAVGPRQVAAGLWRACSAEEHFGMGAGKVAAGDIVSKSLQRRGDDHARVRHVYKGDVTAVFDYAFDGPDVTIQARVENNHASEHLAVTGFRGLRFTWSAPPRGLLFCTHGTWLRAHPGEALHPGMTVKIGGSYGADESFGVGTCPANAELLRTLTMWDYTDWTPPRPGRPSRELLPNRDLQYFVAADIPPLGARAFGLTLRVSTHRDWRHLLAPYKQWLARVLGPVRYRPDHRPVIQVCANKSARYITPQNPHGYHDGLCRLDTAAGARQFCDTLIPMLKAVGGQGVIIWGQQGTEVRGAEYRPDFDVLPPETQANWATLQRRFKDAGLKLGVCTRPDSIPTRVSWKHDGLVDLNADDRGHVEMLWRRFERMIGMGCGLFYMDCFGMRAEDVRLMRLLRAKMGPSVQTYSEMHCDAILPYTGLYMEINYRVAAEGAEPFSITWLGGQQWDIFRWLMDGRIATAVRPNIETKAGRAEPAFYYPWMLGRHLTPLEQPPQLKAGLATLKDLSPRRIDEAGQWKDTPPAGADAKPAQTKGQPP